MMPIISAKYAFLESGHYFSHGSVSTISLYSEIVSIIELEFEKNFEHSLIVEIRKNRLPNRREFPFIASNRVRD